MLKEIDNTEEQEIPKKTIKIGIEIEVAMTALS